MATNGEYFSQTLMPERIAELGEQMLEANRAAAKMCLDAYEKACESVAEYQELAATQTGVDWIARAGKAQAQFTRELASAQVAMGRQFLG